MSWMDDGTGINDAGKESEEEVDDGAAQAACERVSRRMAGQRERKNERPEAAVTSLALPTLKRDGREGGSMEHHRFTRSDWARLPGAARFADGSEPFITDGFTALIGGRELHAYGAGDASGLCVWAYNEGVDPRDEAFDGEFDSDFDANCWIWPHPAASPHLISTILAGLPSTLTENDLHAFGFKGGYHRLSAAEVGVHHETRNAEVQATLGKPQSQSAEMNDLKVRYEDLLRRAEDLQAESAYLRSRMEALGISAPASAPVEAAGGVGRTLLAVLAGIGGWGVGLALARRANPDPGAAIRNYSPDWPKLRK